MNSLVLSEPSRPARSASDPDPEVPAKARRRTFMAKYKLDTLEEAEAARRRCSGRSDAQEAWPQAADGERGGGLVAELERENGRLRQKLAQAETILEVQKKLSQLLGTTEESL